MPRKRHKTSQKKAPAPATQNREPKTSPAAQVVAQRSANGGADFMMQRLISIMSDSAQLAEEPEFRDLFLNGEKTAEVSERWWKKYEKRLARAEKKGPDEYHEVFDEMRIEVVEELATPVFRKEVNERLQALLDRLITTNDLAKLEMVMLLQPWLGMKSAPWGVCGLVMAIYNRTMQRAIQQYEQEKSVYDTLVEALIAEGDDDMDILEILDNPDKIEQIAHKLFEAQPDLRERAEQQVLEMVEAFEDELGRGGVDLNLFSEEELMLPFERINSEFGEPFTQEQLPEEVQKHLFGVVRQAITEIMTPERLRRLHDEVDQTAKTWLRTHHEWAAALQFELGNLEGDQYEENKFILAAFIGQIYRLGKDPKPARKSRKRV